MKSCSCALSLPKNQPKIRMIVHGSNYFVQVFRVVLLYCIIVYAASPVIQTADVIFQIMVTLLTGESTSAFNIESAQPRY